MSDEPFARQDASDRPAATPSGHSPEELALDLTRDAVRLVARDASGEWIELGAVPLAAGDFRAGMDALRQCAEALGPRPVTLWLPPDQILVRRYVLKRGDRGAEALRRLAEDTGRPAGELTIALSPATNGELVTVLGASRRTVAEAVEYAGRWGFRPARVSTRVEAERFGTAGAAFAMPEPAARGARIGARMALAAAAATLAIGLGGWAAYGLLPPSDPGPSDLGPSGPGPLALASAPEAATPHPEERRSEASPASPARLEVAPRDSSGAAPADLSQGRPGQAGASPAGDDAARPSEPAVAAAPDTPARLGRGSAPPDRRGSAQRPRSAAPEAGADLGNLLAGIDRIRVDDAGEEVAAPESPPDDEIVVAASDAAPLAVPGAPPPRPGDPDAAEPAVKPVAGPDLELEDDGIEAEGSDLPTTDIQVSDSRLATVEAPKPPARPERPARAEQAAAPRWQATPPRIGNAAAQGSMALDATSLIGVIDATSGRKALLRTPSGDFVKVARGDEVAGWRVNAIGQDAMRLTKGDESRTLLLVTR